MYLNILISVENEVNRIVNNGQSIPTNYVLTDGKKFLFIEDEDSINTDNLESDEVIFNISETKDNGNILFQYTLIKTGMV